MIYEILNDQNEVINRIEADQWFVDEVYNGRYREYIEPVVMKTQFTALGFRNLFTLEEQVAIRQAQEVDMEVGVMYDNFLAASFIDLEDVRVQTGLGVFVAKGLITEGRKDEILTPQEWDGETELEPSEAHTFTALEFLSRFTTAEQIAVRQARQSDDLVAIAYEWFMESEYVDVRDPMTVQGIDLYIEQGLVDASRRDEVLSPKEE